MAEIDVVREAYLVGHSAHSKGAGLQRLQIFVTFYMCAHSLSNNNRILHGDHSRWDENFYRVYTTNADAQSAAANLLVRRCCLFGVCVSASLVPP